MTADRGPAEILADARRDGIAFAVAGNGLVTFRGPRGATERWVPLLRRVKPAIETLLKREMRHGWNSADWIAYYNERAAVREYDGGMTRAEAEAAAIEDCIVEWLDQAHTTTPAGVCAHCGRDGQVETVLPHGTERAGHVWMHGRCWPAWYAGRKSDALAAFSAMGLPTGVTSKMKSNSNA